MNTEFTPATYNVPSNETQTAQFTINPVPQPTFGTYTFEFSATDSFGSTNWHEAVDCLASFSVSTSEQNYGVGQQVEIYASIRNIGSFRQNYQVNCSVPDIAYDSQQSVSVIPGADETACFTTTALPQSIGEGSHAVNVDFVLTGGGSGSDEAAFNVPPGGVKLEVLDTSVSAGESIVVKVTNLGGRNAEIGCDMTLYRGAAITYESNGHSASLSPLAFDYFYFAIPVDALSGAYVLTAEATDAVSGASGETSRAIEISGLEPGLDVHTDQSAYQTGESIEADAMITNGGESFSGTLLLQVVRAGEAGELWVSASADPVSGQPPLTVQFDMDVSGGVEPYEYLWDFGDGVGSSSEKSTDYIYNTSGTFTATAYVSDAEGEIASDTVEINAGGIEWQQGQKDHKKSGLGSVVGPTTDNLRWSYEFNGDINNAPVVGNGGIYLFDSYQILALHQDGTFWWTYSPSEYSLRMSPCLGADGDVYGAFGGYEYTELHRLSPSGELVWSTGVSGSGDLTQLTIAPSGDVIFAFGNPPTLCAVKPDGSTRFDVGLAGCPLGLTACDDSGNIYNTIMKTDGIAQVVSHSSEGAFRWSYTAAPNLMFIGGPAISEDGTVIAGASTGSEFELYALNPSSGAIEWSYIGAGDPVSGASFAEDGTVYFAADTVLYSVEPGGSLNWTAQLSDNYTSVSGIVIDADEKIYTMHFGGIECFDESGESVFKLETGHIFGPGGPNMALTADGGLLTSSMLGFGGFGDPAVFYIAAPASKALTPDRNGALWEKSVTVSVPEDGTLNISEAVGPLSSGRYRLLGTLSNSSGQTLSTDSYSFEVFGDDALALSIDTDADMYAPGDAISIFGEAINYTDNPLNGLSITIFAAGVPIYISNAFDLGPGDSFEYGTSFAAPAAGEIALTAECAGATSSKTISIEGPSISDILIAPTEVGDDPFEITLMLINSSPEIGANLTVDKGSDHSLVHLQPEDSECLEWTEQIAADKSYSIEISGDYTNTHSFTISYGPNVIIGIPIGEAFLAPTATIDVEFVNASNWQTTVETNFRLEDSSGNSFGNRTVSPSVPKNSTVREPLTFDGLQAGDYTLFYSNRFETGFETINITSGRSVGLWATLGDYSDGSIPLQITVQNDAGDDVSGVLSVTADFCSAQQSLTVEAGGSQVVTFDVNVVGAPLGDHTLTVSFGGTGAPLAEADLQLSLDATPIVTPPDSQEVVASQQMNLLFDVANAGNVGAEFNLHFDWGDVADEHQNYWLEPTEEHLFSVEVTVPVDLAGGAYTALYDVNGVVGYLTINVTGVDISVDLGLDKETYSSGETALLALDVNSNEPMANGIPLYAAVKFTEYDEQQSFTLAESNHLTFEVPVTFERGHRIDVGIHDADSGRSIYLNTIYLEEAKSDNLTLFTDKQVYTQGDTVNATVETSLSGLLHVSAPGYSAQHTLSGSSINFSFDLPDALPIGTHSIDYEIRDCGCEEQGVTYSYSFDVAGPFIRIVDAVLDQTSYEPGETITSVLRVASNVAANIRATATLTAPDGDIYRLGSDELHLTAGDQNILTISGELFTSSLGVHEVEFALCDANDESIVHSTASEHFDVGDANLVSIETEFAEYQSESQDVVITVKVYATNSSSARRRNESDLFALAGIKNSVDISQGNPTRGPVDAVIELFIDENSLVVLPVALSSGYNVFSGSIGSWIAGSHTARVELEIDTLTCSKGCAFSVLDTAGPEQIDDLMARYGRDGSEIELIWSAPGDAVSGSRCKSYQARAWIEPITDLNWGAAVDLAAGFSPSEPNGYERMIANIPHPGTTVYFAVRSTDNAGNLSPISNSASHLIATEMPATAKIYLNSALLSDGDRLHLTCNQYNPGEERSCDLYVAVMIGQSLLFYPNWGPDWTFSSVDLPAHYAEEDIVLIDATVAPWIPSGDLLFMAAFAEAGTLDILGEIASVSSTIER
ncbi:MAG: PKD domain-containing protein [Candidatus Coatesbacteria bacterium]|nr:PKD domain-containing protein [Candidatus Coatesbacteria bacterium]